MATCLTGWENQDKPGLEEIYLLDNRLTPQTKFKQIDIDGCNKNLHKKQVRSRFLIACPKKNHISKQKISRKQNLNLLTINPYHKRKTSLEQTRMKVSKKAITNKQKIIQIIQEFEKKKIGMKTKISNNLSNEHKKFSIISIFEKIEIKTPQGQSYLDAIKQKSEDNKIQRNLSKLLHQISRNKMMLNKNTKLRKSKTGCEVSKSVSYTNLLSYCPIRYETLPSKSKFLLKRGHKTTSEYSLLKKSHNNRQPTN